MKWSTGFVGHKADGKVAKTDQEYVKVHLTAEDLFPENIRATSKELSKAFNLDEQAAGTTQGLNILSRARKENESKPPSEKKAQAIAQQNAENQAILKAIAEDPAGLTTAMSAGLAARTEFLKKYLA
jgi:hypothetical protein